MSGSLPSPFGDTNILYKGISGAGLLGNEALIADTQSKLGQLDINRQTLGLEQRKLDLQQAGGQSILDSLTGGGGTAAPADVTPFEQQMGSAEGGSDPTAVNKQGYAGQFQFGAGRLADLGLYTPAPGEDLKSNQWKGQFHIAPYNVSTLQDFLNNPAAQHAAFTAHVANIDNAINNTPGADKFDRNGLRAVAHLGGVGGMQAFIQSGGNLNSADSNGTTLQQYYRKFAAGGPALLQKSFGSVHGPGGPPSNLPAVQPGGNVSTAWVDPNAPPATAPPPFNPNAGPRVAGASPASPPLPGYPPQVSDANGIAVPTPVRMPDPGAAPVQTSAADASVPVAPSPIALRTGGTDVAGPGAGPDALPPVDAPNRMYQTGLPGITIGANPLAPSATTGAPPGTATAAAASAPGTAPPAGTAPPGGAARPPVLTPPPALPRAIPPPQVLPSGLTAADTRIVAGMVQSGTPTATVAQFIESAKQRNTALQQQYLSNSAAVDQANFARQQWYTEQQQKTGWEDAGNGMIHNKYTGETKYAGPPTPRIGRDESGRQFEVLPGGEMRYLTDNPSGVTGTGDDASALRLMNEIGPKKAAADAGTGPPLTPQEQANYESAVEIYRQPTIVKDENTGSNVKIYKRDLPGYLPPPSSGSMTGGTGPQQLTPGMTPAQRAAETELGKDFATTDKKSYDAANTSLGMLTSANNAADIMNRTPGGWTATGPGANTRLELASHINQLSGLFGGKPVVDPAAIGEWEALNKQTKLMGMQVVNNYFGGSREAASIINGATTAVPNAENSYLGFRMVSSGIEQDLQRQRELYQFKARQLAAGKPLATAEVEFNKQNPVQNYTQRAIANAVPDDIVAHLTANPDTVAAFDKHFGRGIGEFILKGGRTGMGASAGAQAGG